MLQDVAVVIFDGLSPFELGVAHEAWGVDRSDTGLPAFDFAVCSPGSKPVRADGGFEIAVQHGLERTERADLVVVPAAHHDAPVPTEIVDALRAAYDRGARIMSICTGAFVLGAAGLLDGRRCTTHWRYTEALASRFPAAEVVPEVLYVDDAPILSSAGTAAGIDASLYLWRQEFGSAAASEVARRMVVPPQRDGGQAQFIRHPVPQDHSESFGPLLAWAMEHLDEPLDVETLARRALMSPRTFARRFREELGTTPHAWVTAQRLRRAEELLEESDLPVEQVAASVGFGNAATLRHHLGRSRGLSPQQYRRRFAAAR